VPPLGEILRQEIARHGPISFRRFMELALYHPQRGYYSRPHDPFGAGGDFYTAEQLQPVFGRLIAARVGALFEELGRPPEFTVVELGAGRGEMAEAFSAWRYLPIDVRGGTLPERFTGVVVSNEFFDALPVEAARRRGEEWRELGVGWNGERFIWVERGAVGPEVKPFIDEFLPGHGEGDTVEVNLEALRWMERIARSLERGFVFTIDYGFTRRESARFPHGTLMSYRRHIAREDVLAEPGERDLTAHVCFTALAEHGRRCGLDPLPLQSLAQALLASGEAAVAAALRADSAAEENRRRLQLQTLLFSMGDTFRVLIQRQAGRGVPRD
jgi:SAM-dependent MidA family methyltransferase